MGIAWYPLVYALLLIGVGLAGTSVVAAVRSLRRASDQGAA